MSGTAPGTGSRPVSLVIGLSVVALVAACELTPRAGGSTATCPDQGLASLAGSYGAGGATSDDVVTFRESRGELLMHPALWPGPMVLRRVTADSFVVTAHPDFGVTFVHGPDGCPTRARVRGLSSDTPYQRLGETPGRPVRLLLAGRPVETACRYVASDPAGTERFVEVGRRLLGYSPPRPSLAGDFFGELGRLLPDEPSVHAARGDALIAAGERREAVRAYQRALALDSTNPDAVAAGGMWEGWQLVPRAWVDCTTRWHSDVARPDGTPLPGAGYGMMWWVHRPPDVPASFRGQVFSAEGTGSQVVLILPALDIVFVHRTDTDLPFERFRSASQQEVFRLLAKILEARLADTERPKQSGRHGVVR